jgi:hypothetical protein
MHVQFHNGMTIRELKDLVKDLPETNPSTGENFEVWMEVEEGLTSPVVAAWTLNKGDILLSPESDSHL